MVKRRMENDKKMEMIPDDGPYFFKILFAGLTTQKLRIPPCFMKHISKELSDRATLKGPSGSCWNVKLNHSTGGTFLQDGWQVFLKDHSLGDNEILLFRYDGDMCFSVQIFDKSGCERVDISDSRKHQESTLPTEKRKRGRPRKYPIPSKPSEDGQGQHLPRQVSSIPEKVKEEKDTQRKIKEEESDLPAQEMSSQHMNIKEEKDIKRKIKTEEPDLPTVDMDADTQHCVSGEQHPSEEEKLGVWKEAESFTSTYPYFVSCLKKACVQKVYILAVPIPFSRAHLPQCKTKMVLKNLKGEAWVVNSIPAGGKHYLCGGWAAFARSNNLKQDDICIFELVDKSEMRVHIFQTDQGN